jgi:hypothetical protein
MTSSTTQRRIDSVNSTTFGGSSRSLSETTVSPLLNGFQMPSNVLWQTVDRWPSCAYETTLPQQVARISATNASMTPVLNRPDHLCQSSISGYSASIWPTDTSEECTGYMQTVTVTSDAAPVLVFDNRLRAPDIHSTNNATSYRVNIVYSFSKWMYSLYQAHASTDERSKESMAVERVDYMQITHTSQCDAEYRLKNHQGTGK